MSRSKRGRRWITLVLVGAVVALVLLYTWPSGRETHRAPEPERGASAERASEPVELTLEEASTDPESRGPGRGLVTGEISVPSSTTGQDGTGVSISVVHDGRVVALAAAEPGSFRVEYPRPDPDAEYELRASLISVRGTLPSIGGKVSSEGSVVTFPPAVLELYSLRLSAPARLVDRTTRSLRPREVSPVWRLRLPADEVEDVVIAQPPRERGR